MRYLVIVNHAHDGHVCHVPEVAEGGEGEHQNDERHRVADHFQDPAHLSHKNLDLKKKGINCKCTKFNHMYTDNFLPKITCAFFRNSCQSIQNNSNSFSFHKLSCCNNLHISAIETLFFFAKGTISSLN